MKMIKQPTIPPMPKQPTFDARDTQYNLPIGRLDRLDQVIADITYVRSCLKLLKTIQESGDCNICKKKRTCEYVPKFGEQVRYNCPFFEREVTE